MDRLRGAGETEILVEPVVGVHDGLSLPQRESLGAKLGEPEDRAGGGRGNVAGGVHMSPAEAGGESGGISTDELVFQTDDGLRGSRIALPGAASEKLAVNASGLVPLGGDHVEAAELGDAPAELDVRASSGHVRR
ncbi:MAG: hypothetical protein JXB13_10210, partial [Phycisphaerae bacterium]|nr:hypothetical protein [Phycisphaerae bacterium]